MVLNDCDRTDYNHCALRACYHADRVFAVSALLGKRKTPEYITYLGKALPAAIFGMLVVYCLKSVDIAGGSHGLPELISLAVLTAIHLWRKNMLLSIAAGTVCYMLLEQFVFV